MDYKVEVETKDVLLAGTDAKIYCKLTDVNGTTTPTIWLKDSDNDCFEKGHVDLFKFTFKGSRITHPLAPLYKCKIWQNGHGSKADWDLKRITFHPHGSKEYSFTFNRCIKKDKHEECLVDGEDGVASTYQIKTHTSDIMYAKTNNTVKLNIIGSKGHTGFMTLDNKLQNVFERGTEDDFKKTRHCVGTIKKIQVQLNADNVFSDAAGDFLHLQSITISELITEQHLYFPINIWLKPNCKFEIEPRPFPKHEVQPGPQITKKYTGVITTGDKLLAGTNANVHIYLTDTKGRTTGAIRVREKGGDTMERGDKDQIAVELTGHYDDLETIGVSQDGAGAGSDWYLEKIELTEVNPITGENIGDELVFKFNEWIKTNQKVSRHFQPKVNKKYIGVIVTGDVLMAGTDANVDIYLTDKAGISTGAIRVREKGADGMEREDEDPITIELTGQYGKLETVGISQDGEGARSDWYLERIELTEVDPTSGDAISEKHIFTFQKWIKTNKTVSRSLSHKVEPIKPNNSPVQTKFTGLVVTGEDAMAGTDANVQIFLTDIQGHKTKGIMLRERGGDAMEKNSENVLYINLSQKLGPLESVEVEHDGHGPYPDWFLDRIELSEAEIATGKVKEASKKIFYFNRWIKPKTRESSFYKAPPQEPQIKTIITGYIQTADKIGAGTDAHVELWVTDAKGTTVGPLMLKEKGDAMERNQKNDIKLKILDELVPPLYKVCLRQDGHGFADAWELKKVVLSFELPVGITDKATFLYQKVLKSGKLYDMGRYNKDTEIANGPIKYEIQVITSNAEHAGTDDNVFIEIVGTKGRTGKRPLKVGKFRDGFERGQTDICKLTAVNIGDYKGVILHKDGENNWRVSQVSVKTEKENFSKFVAGDKIVGPEGLKIAFSGRSTEVERTHAAQGADIDKENVKIEKIQISERTLSIFEKIESSEIATRFVGVITTSDIEGAGTDAKVEIWLSDSSGKTIGPILLREANGNWNDAMERGQQDPIRIDLRDELVDLMKIGIKQDGKASDWHLDNIQLTKINLINKENQHETLTFNFNKWIKGNILYEQFKEGFFPTETPAIVEEITTIRPVVSKPEYRTKFRGAVHTSDIQFAGTDANLLIWVTDYNGVTVGPIKCVEKGDAMERGQVNKLKINLLDDLADIYKITITHDGKGLNDEWHLNKIVLQLLDKNDSVVQQIPTEFIFDKWIKPNIIYECAPNNIKNTAYTVRIKTSDIMWAGTDDDVYLEVIGTKGRTQQRKLHSTIRNNFEKGQKNNFVVHAVDMGELESVALYKHGNDDWMVQSVEIDCPGGELCKFNFDNQKITMAGLTMSKILPYEFPHKINPILKPEVIDLTIRSKFTGKVITSDKLGAGTDAKVQIWFTDINGKTAGPIVMQEKGGNAMERAHSNPLQVNLIDELKDVYKVSIKHDGSGPGDQWHLDRIELTLADIHTGLPIKSEPDIFRFEKWIKSNKMYEAGANDVKLSLYKVKIKTSRMKGAGTDDTVYLNIVGEKGRTEKRKLDTKWHDDFERGNIDTFDIKAVDLGSIKGIILYKEGNDNWVVSYVEIKDEAGKFSTFLVDDKEVGADGLKVPKYAEKINPINSRRY